MAKLILRWLIGALTLTLVSRVVPGVAVDSLYSALIAALLLGLVNVTIRPIILLLSLPITLLTLGLFSFVVNALMLLQVASIVKGFHIDGFAPALAAAVVLWLVSWATNWLFEAAERK